MANHTITSLENPFQFESNQSRNYSATKPSNDFMTGLYSTYVIIMCTSLVANSLLSYIVYTRSTMRCSTNCLFANMAVADLIITTASMPIWSYFICIAQNWLQGLAGNILCSIAASISVFTVLASTMTLMAISLDRFVAVFFPLKRLLITNKVKRIVVVIWMLSAVVGVPCLYMYNVRQEDGRKQCLNRLDKINPGLRRVYYVLVFAFMFGLPVIIMTTFYVMIALKLWFRHIPGHPSDAGRRALIRGKRKAVRLLIVLLVAFVSCWLPVHIEWLREVFTSTKRKEGIAIVLAHANSAINPCLVFALNASFKKELMKILKSLCCITVQRADFFDTMTMNKSSHRNKRNVSLSRAACNARCHSTGAYTITEIPKGFAPVTLISIAAVKDSTRDHIWAMYGGSQDEEDPHLYR